MNTPATESAPTPLIGFEKDEVMSSRCTERSETISLAPNDLATHWLLVIDHHEARIFRSEMKDAIPQRILPPEPQDYNPMDCSRGRDKPEPNSFYEPIAKTLQGDGQILIFGAEKGMSSEMEQFVAWSTTHHPELAGRIIGTLTVDERHPGQLLAKAREFYGNASIAPSAEGTASHTLDT